MGIQLCQKVMSKTTREVMCLGSAPCSFQTNILSQSYESFH